MQSETTRIPVEPRYSSPIRTADGLLLPSHGARACSWIEANCRYGEGDWYGERVVLRDFQVRYLWRLYEYYPDDFYDPVLAGRRRYKRALWGAGKGSGKTPLAGFVGSYELAGGQNVSPRVQVAAAAEDQADLIFGDMQVTFKEGPLAPFVDVFDKEILLRNAPGVAERLAANLGTRDGPRATCLLADELHEWTGRLGRMFAILDGAIAKRRQAFTLITSTAGIDDEELVLKQQYDYGRRVASGEVVDDSFLFEWYEADVSLDLDDPDQWLTAVMQANPAAGDFQYLENIRSRFNGAQQISRSEFKRYHLNQWVKGEEIWDVAGVWDELAYPGLELDPELPLFVAVDVGIRHDSSAVVAGQLQDWLDEEGEPIKVVALVATVWENPYARDDARHDRWRMDLGLVSKRLRELRSAFAKTARELDGPAFFYDKMFFESEAASLELDGLNMLEYPQTDARMIPASGTFLTLAMNRLIAHDGDREGDAAAFSRHVNSVVPHQKPRGFRISKPRGSRSHIDAAVAAAIAAHEAMLPVEEDGGSGIRVLGPAET